MKYIKNFENNLRNDIPKIGDYIQIFLKQEMDNSGDFVKYANFITQNIGKIIYINYGNVRVEYYNIPAEIHRFFDKNYGKYEIKYSKVFNLNNKYVIDDYIVGKTPEEVEMKNTMNKYNI